MRRPTRRTLATLAGAALIATGTVGAESPARDANPLSVFDVPGFAPTDPQERLRNQHRTARRAVANDLAEVQRLLERADALTDPGVDEEAVAHIRALREEARALLARSREVMAPFEAAHAAREYLQLVERIAEQTARLRGLELKHPIVPIVLGGDQLREVLDAAIDAELTPERLRGEGLTWIAMDLLPPGTDIRMVYTNLLEEQVGGLYDEKTGTLYVVDTFDPRSFLGGVILSHEICHALQDMHFDISSLPFRTENNDQNLATAAILEGDATLLMVEWGAENFRPTDLLQFNQLMSSQARSLAEVPPALVQSMLFPYVGGLDFLQRLQAMGVEDARNHMFRHIPQSTAQILNPERYYPEREEPVTVTLTPWSDGTEGLAEVYRGVTGEWMTRLILTPPDAFPTFTLTSLDLLVSERVAVEGARGWNGDQMATLASDDDQRWAVAWKSIWVSEEDAEEFAAAWVRRLGYRPGFSDKDLTLAPGDRFEATGSDGLTTIVEVRGDEAFVVLASDPQTAVAGVPLAGW